MLTILRPWVYTITYILNNSISQLSYIVSCSIISTKTFDLKQNKKQDICSFRIKSSFASWLILVFSVRHNYTLFDIVLN